LFYVVRLTIAIAKDAIAIMITIFLKFFVSFLSLLLSRLTNGIYLISKTAYYKHTLQNTHKTNTPHTFAVTFLAIIKGMGFGGKGTFPQH